MAQACPVFGTTKTVLRLVLERGQLSIVNMLFLFVITVDRFLYELWES